MTTEISILMPTYNDVCIEVVRELARQAEAAEGLRWEIIVADDGSTDASAIAANEAINQLSHCRYIRRTENVGRARIRNFLAREAQYRWLLFVDSGMGIVRRDFLKQYMQAANDGMSVIYGGYEIVGNDRELSGNLRYLYEKSSERLLSIDYRREHPYDNFHTSNFMIAKSVYAQHPLDERFRRYGYEDVLLGKRLKEAQITIMQIDNPVGFDRFESNTRFIEKTEDGLLTLHEFAYELQQYSRLLALADRLRRCHLRRPYLYIYNRCRERWRKNLCGSHPSLQLFKAYKLGYLLTLQA